MRWRLVTNRGLGRVDAGVAQQRKRSAHTPAGMSLAWLLGPPPRRRLPQRTFRGRPRSLEAALILLDPSGAPLVGRVDPTGSRLECEERPVQQCKAHDSGAPRPIPPTVRMIARTQRPFSRSRLNLPAEECGEVASDAVLALETCATKNKARIGPGSSDGPGGGGAGVLTCPGPGVREGHLRP